MNTQSAFPFLFQIPNNDTQWEYGLTKREYFAAMAMQANVSRYAGPPSHLAEEAVRYADALIVALDSSSGAHDEG